MTYYKIVRIAGIHSDAAKKLVYQRDLHLSLKSYEEQKEVLFAKRIMYGDVFSYEMKALGHEAEEIVYDLEPLQKKWADEKGIKFDSNRWQEEIILAQLNHLKPDVVYFQDIHSLSYETRKTLKKRVPSIRKIVIFRGYPGTSSQIFKELSTADLLLVGSPVMRALAEEKGLNPHLVYHFFDTRILADLSQPSHIFDFSFVGSSGYGYGRGHKDRYWMLFDLLEKSPIELWIDEPGKELRKFWKKRVRAQMIQLLKGGISLLNPSLLNALFQKISSFPRLKGLIEEQIELKKEKGFIRLPKKPLSEIFSSRCRNPLFGIEMFQILHQSRIVLNKHSNPAGKTVDNIRMFQATGVGTCLLTDTGSNLKTIFEPDKEVVTYSSLDECIEKVNYLLSHEKERLEIAKAGQKRTLKDHSSKIRIKEIDELIQRVL